MDNIENVFNQDDTSWLLLGASTSSFLLQQQQHQSNNEILHTQNISTNTNTTAVINNENTSKIDNNIQIQEQILLLQQQSQQQQYLFQQHFDNYQQQQTHTFEQRQLQYQQNNPLIDNYSAILLDNYQQQQIYPIIDHQILVSMNSPQYSNTTNTITTTTKTIADNKPKANNNEKPKKEDKNRVYHKKHREKKKDHVKEVEHKIAVLTFENLQLKKENQTIKTKGESIDVMKPDEETIELYKESMQIIHKMKEALKKNDEISLIYLLHLYHLKLSSVYTTNQREIESVFHPNVQLILTRMSYIPHNDPIIYDIISGPGSDLWLHQYKEEAELTTEQSNKLDSIRAKFSILDDKYLKERLELDQEVKRLYSSHILMLPDNPLISVGINDQEPYITDLSQTPIMNTKSMDLNQTLEFINKLVDLRNKVFLGRMLLMDVFTALSTFLTPKQEALFLVRINLLTSLDDSSFNVLSDVWSNIISAKSLSGALDIVEALEKYFNGKNKNSNNYSTTTPFSLKPATFNPPSK